MTDFARARRTMVDNQLRTSGITNWRILDVMNSVPRERFVPETRRELAYIDEPVRLSASRAMPAPAALARLIQLAEVSDGDVVLDVGCGMGYSTAVLAGLAARVVGLDDDEAMAARARDMLAGLDVANASVVTGPLNGGAPSDAPFDVIIIQGAVDAVSKALFTQLGEGGRLVAVQGRGNSAVAHLYVKTGRDVAGRPDFNISLPPMEAFVQQDGFQF